MKLLLVFILKLFHLFKAAEKYIEKALELAPQESEWHFMYGKCLGRLRRVHNFNEIPPQKELKALENAVEMTKNASYVIFLAQAYREASFRVFSVHRNDLGCLKDKLDRMYERSAELYRYV
jgi:tetratricopeptide (TPR) repeat protein